MKQNHIKLLVITLVFAAFVFTISSCNPTTSAPIIPLKAGEMQATISPGVGSFFGTNAQNVSNGVTYTISGTMNNDTLGITISVTQQANPPYTINTDADDNTYIVYCILLPDGSGACTKYTAKKGLGSATIKITAISPNVEGTFSGTLKTQDGSSSITITDGAFNAF